MPPISFSFSLMIKSQRGVCVHVHVFVYLSVYEGYNLLSFARLTVYIICQKILYQIMCHNLGSTVLAILLIPNSTGNNKDNSS